MVIGDINIFCAHQKQRTQYEIANAQIDCFGYDSVSRQVVYADRYLLLQKMEGIWYQVYPKARNFGYYDNEFMDLLIEKNEPKVVFCHKKFKIQLQEFLTELYYESPSRTLYFFADLQGYKEKYNKVSWESFLKMMQGEELCFNTVYKICK